MHIISHHGKKALLIDTEDILEYTKPSLWSSEIASRQNAFKEKIAAAKRDEIVYILIVTSLPRRSIPLWIRQLTPEAIHCYRGVLKPDA